MATKNPRMVRPKRPASNMVLDDSDQAVGARVRQVRKAHGLIGQQLADRLGITISSLSHIERGERRLDPRHAGKMLVAFGVDHTWLYCGLPTGLSETTRNLLEKGVSASASKSA